MPKASPMIRSFNGGEISDLLEGRVDLDRYASSAETMFNFIAAPQGPAIGRSGTVFVQPITDETKKSRLVPFIFSNDQSQVLEFSEDRIRFFDEDGILVENTVAATVISAAGATMEVTAPGHGAVVGDEVVLSGFPATYLLNGEAVRVTAVSGDDLILDVTYPDETVEDGNVSLVYKVDVTYTADQLQAFHTLQSLDVIYIMCSDKKTHKLSRFGTYDWRLEDHAFTDGPFKPVNTTTTTLSFTGTGPTGITVTASAVDGINRGDGFQTTDVGRLLRVKNNADEWVCLEITARASTTEVTAKTQDGSTHTFAAAGTEWRIGYWSDTTGWPTTATFFEDRLWLMGGVELPDVFAGSVTSDYENIAQTEADGTVLDDSAIVGRLNSRKLANIRWCSATTRGILIGTGSEEYTLASPNVEVMSPTNIRARPATRRGSADVEPVGIDDSVLYVQRAGRTVRELSYVFEADGYRSPSMTQLASHLGAYPFVEMDYAAEPHSIVWARRSNGSLVGLTYNREENVIGWHRHCLCGGECESLAVIPQKDQLQDALWMVVKRTIDGQTRRYIERLTRFWDFDTELSEAHFVDCGLRYDGAETTVINGLQHLEGETVYGLADGKPTGALTVTNGQVTLPVAGSNIVIGLGYEGRVVTPRLNAGAGDGTAQGKVSRIHNIVAYLWESFGGKIGVWNSQQEAYVYETVEYPGDLTQLEDVSLYTGPVGPIQPSPGYDMEKRIAFVRPRETPLPFNVVALMPQIHTQDR
jgi:hypothetical protein